MKQKKYAKKEKIYPAYVSEHNSNREKQVILLSIPNREKQEANSEGQRWHYLAVNKLSALLREIISKIMVIFIVCIVFIPLEQKANVNHTKKYVKIKIFIIMSSRDTKMIEFDQYQKSDKVPFTIYEHLEYIKEKIDGCKNNPEYSSTTKASKHIPSGSSMSTVSTFKSIESKHDVYRGKNCIKKFMNRNNYF